MKKKNTILKVITFIMAFVFLFCVCCLDSPNETVYNIAIAGGTISGFWLVLFLFANEDTLC